MDLKGFLTEKARESKLIDKFYVFESVKILWSPNKDVKKEDVDKFTNEIEKTIKEYIPGLVIESKIISEGELETVKQITYEQECK
jgi:hypothetical protein